MTLRRKSSASVVLPVVALLLLAGCGGGGGTAMMQPGTGTGTQPGTGTGTQPGTGTGAQPDTGSEPARSAPSLGSLYDSEPERTYTVAGTSLLENYGASTTQLSTAPFVSSIQRNASGGYDIIYQDGTEQITVQILPEHCQANFGCTIPADSNGRTHWFWSWTSSDSLGKPSLYKFMEASGFTANDGSGTQRRSLFVFGVETPASGVPATGEAIYGGRMRARAYRTSEPGSRARQRYRGRIRLVANFDMSRLTGRIFSIQGTAPGEPSSARVSWPTSSFAITNGQIANGQFTATLTGMDSDSAVPDAESVRGFVGSIVAKFYGPNADEFGGTLTATRDLQDTDNDRQLHGVVDGRKLAPRKFESSASIAGVRRRFDSQQTTLFADDGMATVERTANGWTVTVGGQTFTFDDSAYDADPRFPSGYYIDDAGDIRVFQTWTQGFGPASQFDHFDVKSWGTTDFDSGNPTVGDVVYMVHGNRTPDTAMPSSGTATYSGTFTSQEYPSDQAVFSRDAAVMYFWGSATLTANFASSSVAGAFRDMRKRPGNTRTNTAASGGATFNAQISGNQMTASDLTGTGDLAGYRNGAVRGAFFGPAAEEAGGVFDATDGSANRVLSGYFGTKKN